MWVGMLCPIHPFLRRSKIIEGVEVFKELRSSPGASSGLPSSPDSLQLESTHSHSHVDFITDLALVPYKNQQFIVSASHDGVLKLWK